MILKSIPWIELIYYPALFKGVGGYRGLTAAGQAESDVNGGLQEHQGLFNYWNGRKKRKEEFPRKKGNWNWINCWRERLQKNMTNQQGINYLSCSSLLTQHFAFLSSFPFSSSSSSSLFILRNWKKRTSISHAPRYLKYSNLVDVRFENVLTTKPPFLVSSAPRFHINSLHPNVASQHSIQLSALGFSVRRCLAASVCAGTEIPSIAH